MSNNNSDEAQDCPIEEINDKIMEFSRKKSMKTQFDLTMHGSYKLWTYVPLYAFTAANALLEFPYFL